MPPKVDAVGAPVLGALVENCNERTLDELADPFRERTGAGLSLHAVRRACKRLGLRPKNPSLAAAEHAREDVAAARAAWRKAAPALRPEALVFGDESGIAPNMARTTAGRRAAAAPAAPCVRAAGSAYRSWASSRWRASWPVIEGRGCTPLFLPPYSPP